MESSSPVSAELDELTLPEIAVGDLRVRQDQPFRIYHLMPKAHDVEVDRARPPADGPFPPELALDGEERVEQFAGGERGLDRDHLVQIVPLRHGADRRRLLDRRR